MKIYMAGNTTLASGDTDIPLFETLFGSMFLSNLIGNAISNFIMQFGQEISIKYNDITNDSILLLNPTPDTIFFSMEELLKLNENNFTLTEIYVSNPSLNQVKISAQIIGANQVNSRGL